jgi:N utilization substance protein A
MSEIIDALDQLEKEKNISKELIIEAIEKSLVSAGEKEFGSDAIIEVSMDRTTGDITVMQKKLIVEDGEVTNDRREIAYSQAKAMDKKNELGGYVVNTIKSKEFGRIAAQKARNIIVQSIKEGERDAVYAHFSTKAKDIIVATVIKKIDNNLSIRLDEKTEAILTESEQVPGEFYEPGDRIKVYVVDVKKTPKGGCRIIVSRTHHDLVKRLFEREVSEVSDGTVEIKSISREPGSRTKIAVWSNDENVDPVGACVGLNGSRVNSIVDDLKGEKIDIITWSEDPATFIENALSPSKVIDVRVEPDGKSAKVVVPDHQLSLAIGKEGQNARLAARLTGYKIDIKSKSQAKELGMEFDDFEDDYNENYDGDYDDNYDDYDENYDDYDEDYNNKDSEE